MALTKYIYIITFRSCFMFMHNFKHWSRGAHIQPDYINTPLNADCELFYRITQYIIILENTACYMDTLTFLTV